MTDEKSPEAGHSTYPPGDPAHPCGGRFRLFPKMVTRCWVMQPDSVQLIDEAMSRDRIIGMVFAKPTAPGRPRSPKATRRSAPAP